MIPDLSSIDHESFPYLYLKIQSDAISNPIAAELIRAINTFASTHKSVNFETHQLTIRAIIHILDTIYSEEDSPVSQFHYPGALKLLALQYLGIAHCYDDIPELKF